MSKDFILIKKPENFSFQECLWFLDRNYDDCLHEVKEKSVRKLLQIEGMLTLIEIQEDSENLVVEILVGIKNEQIIGDFVSQWFDLERDINPLYDLLNQDDDLKYMTTDYRGLRLLAIPDLFEALCWSVIGQQINLTFAYKLKRRFTEKYGQKLTFENHDYYVFPEPYSVGKLKVEDFQPMQFSTKKAEYIIGIAQLFDENKLSKAQMEVLSTTEAVKELCKVRGIGEWTANYALMKSLQRLECVTYGDVGLYNALHQIKNFPKRPERPLLEAFFAPFKGWEAYVVFYLWRSLAAPK
jgi:DNA-3-methyladenine glycosylase II